MGEFRTHTANSCLKNHGPINGCSVVSRNKTNQRFLNAGTENVSTKDMFVNEIELRDVSTQEKSQIIRRTHVS